MRQQQNLLVSLQGQNGIQNQSSVFNQLQGVANGTGPNPAQAQLAQATGANTANQAALMAGQRGSGANAGLIARQAAQQGAQNQQNAAGQAATMQANQSLNAMNQLAGVAGQQVGQQQQATGAITGAQQTEQQNLLNSIAQQNNANVGMQSNVNSSNAGLAQTQMAGQHSLLGNITGGIGSALGLAKGGMIPHMAGGGYSPIDADYNNHDNVFPANMDSIGATAYNPISTPASPAAPVAPASPAAPVAPTASANPNAAKSSVGKFFQGMNSPAAKNQPIGTAAVGQTIGKGIGAGLSALFGSSAAKTPEKSQVPTEDQYAAQMGAPGTRDANNMPTEDAVYQVMSAPQPQMAQGGKVPAMVSPGEIRIKAKDVAKVANGEKSPMDGEKIPGKPKVGGAKNDYANDTVPKTLSEGDIILPRSVTQAKHPHWEAHKFVSALMAKNGKTLPKKAK